MSILRLTLIAVFYLIICLPAISQDSVKVEAPKKQWYDAIKIRGYTQIRYNGLFQINPDLQCEQCDKSWGGNGGFFIRRARIVIYGQVHERVFIYIQPDLASTPTASVLNFAQIRDAYFDVSLDKKKEYRFRIGQSKVPFGFENLQSSQNRIPLDRNDALNSAVANERDLGVFFYYAPEHIRERFSYLVSSGLKGSGDYGVFGFGVYNGQTANRPEANDNRHIVARLTYPFQLKNGQIIEPGIQGYTGKFTLFSTSPDITAASEYKDRRVAGTIVVYPKPFGIQAEYNIGEGPEFDPQTMQISAQNLSGGYIMANYILKKNGQF
ncbi:MAG: OprO/OprP family phosphate-selective porin, partial [Bacteroidota bacterium]|nr:OprO/OprP family phosphate-selective porin [Bacteroidota bacterium]